MWFQDLWFGIVFCFLICGFRCQVSEVTETTEDVSLDYYVPGEQAENCICVPYYQCDKGNFVDDGRSILEPRKNLQPEELPLDQGFESPACGPFHVCCTAPDEATQSPYIHRCGFRNPSGINPRILAPQGSEESQFGEWPWQIAILKMENNNTIFKCGGTLIDESHVLTVAHCVDTYVDNPEEMLARIGEWDTQTTTEFLPHEDHEIEKIIIHPSYTANNLWNDIAILQLADVVTFKPNVATVCLPKDEDNFIGQQCIVTGWGTDAYKSGEYSNVMKEVSLPVISNGECQTLLRATRLGRYFKLHPSFMCAGGEEGRDSCKGDGGGPLVCYREDGTYTLAGLVSWGIDCGQRGVPGVYVNVQKFIDWIASQTGKNVENYWSEVSAVE